ncbi:ATP-dependent DNA ligase [Intestinibacter sp.]|uniref:ATP-dependent DNA ligase n=1 Tax=Intestinibacter sp. TaxID=1965304 RepID=UPI003F17BC92
MIGGNVLISRDSKGKIRVVEISYQWEDDYNGFMIRRKTYQYGGKAIDHPEIVITKGKAKRTVTEQARLEYNSHLKKYQDKGYKLLEKDISNYSLEDLDNILPEFTTDANGFQKHMLAKQADKVAASAFEKEWYASRKIDGTRCSFYYKDGVIKTASRGGGDYDPACQHFITNKKLITFFENHPDYILDGELYKHGKSLQQISGAARLEKNAYDCDWLEYYIYDVMIPNIPFKDRLEILEEIQDELGLGFDPEHIWNEGDLQMQMVPHVKVSGWLNIKSLHDKYVSEGWEGVVIRDPSKNYKFGGRGNEMIKVKMYQDAEFQVTGISEGLRDEDLCFTCITDDGKEFKAKPMGSRELKQAYRNNLDQIVGKMATVKFFYYSDDGTPLQPVLKCIRDYE